MNGERRKVPQEKVERRKGEEWHLVVLIIVILAVVVLAFAVPSSKKTGKVWEVSNDSCGFC